MSRCRTAAERGTQLRMPECAPTSARSGIMATVVVAKPGFKD